MTSRAGWRTGRRGAVCGRCEKAFVPRDAVISALFEMSDASDGSDGGDDDAPPPFERADLCTACFEAEDAPAPYSWWRTEVPEPDRRRAPLDLQVAREFLVRLLDEGAPERANLRYLLALLLMRKRLVRVEEQFRDAERGELMVVTVPPDETLHEIPCPELGEEETAQLRDELGRLFDLGDGDGDGDAAQGAPA